MRTVNRLVIFAIHSRIIKKIKKKYPITDTKEVSLVLFRMFRDFRHGTSRIFDIFKFSKLVRRKNEVRP